MGATTTLTAVAFRSGYDTVVYYKLMRQALHKTTGIFTRTMHNITGARDIHNSSSPPIRRSG